jgi:hypothetical protein
LTSACRAAKAAAKRNDAAAGIEAILQRAIAYRWWRRTDNS